VSSLSCCVSFAIKSNFYCVMTLPSGVDAQIGICIPDFKMFAEFGDEDCFKNFEQEEVFFLFYNVMYVA